MRHDLAEKWGERLLRVEAQLEREAEGAMRWHWRGEAKVLRFLLRRYGECEMEPPALGGTSAFESSELSPLERSLLRLSLLIPNIQTKHSRPSPHDRAAILQRIRVAGDEARESDEEESFFANLDQWIESWGYGGAKTRQNALRLREREEEWKRRQRELDLEQRERRR